MHTDLTVVGAEERFSEKTEKRAQAASESLAVITSFGWR